ncbi:MAG TPA: hypothetical protein PKA21_08970 [Kiritimatiellia bacterium]|nr:hypothetical protein [Kiritimatiellia bacterium]HMP35015.1 hypothetical protein [Kiritimatiellia bacterium]
MSQTNTQRGLVVRRLNAGVYGPLPSDADWQGKLVRLTIYSGAPPVPVAPCSTPAQFPHFVILDGRSTDTLVSVIPLSPDQPVRVRLVGTCVSGQEVCVATGSAPDANTAGNAQALPTSAGTYAVFGVAEEPGVDGQLVLVRPMNPRLVTVEE